MDGSMEGTSNFISGNMEGSDEDDWQADSEDDVKKEFKYNNNTLDGSLDIKFENLSEPAKYRLFSAIKIHIDSEILPQLVSSDDFDNFKNTELPENISQGIFKFFQDPTCMSLYFAEDIKRIFEENGFITERLLTERLLEVETKIKSFVEDETLALRDRVNKFRLE